MRLSGALKNYKKFDVTPVLGTEFVDVNLADMMKAPNSDDLIRELAIIGKPTIASKHRSQSQYVETRSNTSYCFQSTVFDSNYSFPTRCRLLPRAE